MFTRRCTHNTEKLTTTTSTVTVVPPSARFIWVFECPWGPLALTLLSYYYYYMLVHFLLLRFTLGFGFYLFAIGVCIFVCYFLLYFCFLIYARAQCALRVFLLSSLTCSLVFVLSLFTVAAYARLLGACKRRFLFVQ